ncbi:nucleotide exchange factor GrpE [Caldalkalibacillus salinus]|uniref:nucleotide exchange factor GrpE n=1 Tax=Caldalkalibacillus salinus TaxID=2803787 RepID=UPI001922C155
MSTEQNHDVIQDEQVEQKEVEDVDANQDSADAADSGEGVDAADDTTNEQQFSHDEEAVDVSGGEMQRQLQEAEKKAAEFQQKYLRAQADFDNFRRRTRQEKEEQAKYASLPLVEKLLPALDNFERALAASQDSQDPELAKGVDMVYRQIDEVLKQEGLEPILTVGEAFDPNVHQAVMQEESDEYESGIVTEELQKGYKLKDKVIRPAMVKVSS